ncbi:MAG: hypothetical protein LBQ36_01390 [Synergistaceae bacterium]|nr:hypothetical protein [Synergistaceae bacterium]
MTLFFWVLHAPRAFAAASEFDYAFTGYLTRMLLAMLLLGGLGYAAVKFLPGRLMSASRGHIHVIGARGLGRDMMYIVRTGPQVIAFFAGKSGAVVLGRWSLEEWEDYEAASQFSREAPNDNKAQ